MYKRQSVRLHHYNYSREGSYFITICTQDRECLFGEIVDGEMVLNKFGEIVQQTWIGLPKRFRNMELDHFVIMPNHFHGIVSIVDKGWGTARRVLTDSHMNSNVGAGSPRPPRYNTPCETTRMGAETAPLRPNTLGQTVAYFKYQSTKRINEIRQTPGQSLWQRNYYEHVIRSEEDLLETRQYIQDNPIQWALDPENVSVNA